MNTADEFAAFLERAEPKLRRALIAKLGPAAAREATQDALSWAWENWSKVQAMDNPLGYLYRVATSKAKWFSARRPEPWQPLGAEEELSYEPRIGWALAQLTERQRVVVLLVHGWGWHLVEVANLLGISESSTRTHAARGLERLRSLLEVEHAGS